MFGFLPVTDETAFFCDLRKEKSSTKKEVLDISAFFAADHKTTSFRSWCPKRHLLNELVGE